MPLPTPHLPKTENDTLRARAEALHLHGLLTHWSEVATQPWLAPMLDWEEQQRARRSLERRLSAAHIGRFKPLCDFDWTWPKHCDRAAVDALITLDFLKEAANVVFVGPNGVGKSMFAQNIAHQAVIDGHTVLFTSAGQLLGDLCALDSDFHPAAPPASLCQTTAAGHRFHVESAVMWSCPILTPALLGGLRIRHQVTPHNHWHHSR